jgi:hypothetical protein
LQAVFHRKPDAEGLSSGRTEGKRRGAKFSAIEDWAVHVVQDGLLINGQNPPAFCSKRSPSTRQADARRRPWAFQHQTKGAWHEPEI